MSVGASEVINNIQAAADGSLGVIQDADRLELLASCARLRASLEGPLEAAQRIALSVRRWCSDSSFKGVS